MDATEWDERYRSADRVWSAEPNIFVAEETAGLPPGRVIDLAGGEGRNALWLAERGWDAEVVEFSSVALEKASTWAADRGLELRCTQADATGDVALEPADLVLVAYLQLPSEEFAHAFHTAAAALRSGGTLLVISHARENLEDGYGGPPDPRVLATADQLDALAAAEGLTVESVGNRERQVSTPDGLRTAIDVVLRATR